MMPRKNAIWKAYGKRMETVWLACGFVIVALSGAVALAEDVSEYEARVAFREAGLADLRSCVENGDPLTCIAMHAHACIEKIARNHSEEGDCVVEELRLWRVIHAEVLNGRMQEAMAGDQEGVRLDSASIGTARVALLIEAEAQWREYADAQCRLEMLHWGAGTITMTARPYCDIRLVAGRVATLKDLQL